MIFKHNEDTLKKQAVLGFIDFIKQKIFIFLYIAQYFKSPHYRAKIADSCLQFLFKPESIPDNKELTGTLRDAFINTLTLEQFLLRNRHIREYKEFIIEHATVIIKNYFSDNNLPLNLDGFLDKIQKNKKTSTDLECFSADFLFCTHFIKNNSIPNIAKQTEEIPAKFLLKFKKIIYAAQNIEPKKLSLQEITESQKSQHQTALKDFVKNNPHVYFLFQIRLVFKVIFIALLIDAIYNFVTEQYRALPIGAMLAVLAYAIDQSVSTTAQKTPFKFYTYQTLSPKGFAKGLKTRALSELEKLDKAQKKENNLQGSTESKTKKPTETSQSRNATNPFYMGQPQSLPTQRKDKKQEYPTSPQEAKPASNAHQNQKVDVQACTLRLDHNNTWEMPKKDCKYLYPIYRNNTYTPNPDFFVFITEEFRAHTGVMQHADDGKTINSGGVAQDGFKLRKDDKTGEWELKLKFRKAGIRISSIRLSATEITFNNTKHASPEPEKHVFALSIVNPR